MTEKRTAKPQERTGNHSYAPVIRAFRTYARLGLDKDELPPYLKYSRIRGVTRTDEEAVSLLAVCDTLRILRLSGKRAALSAVKQVWMARCFHPLGKQEISMRVRKASFLLFCDERTVYRYLRTAADMYREILRENDCGECGSNEASAQDS